MSRGLFRAFVVSILCLLLPGAARAVCVADPVSASALQFDIDSLFGGLDLTLGGSFPAWLERYNQDNANDPTAAFGAEDNAQNGIDDDDHLDLLGAILDGEPSATVLSGILPANVSDIRTSYAANRAKVRPDLTLTIIFISVNIIDEINKDDPAFGESLQDLVAAYMTIGDAESTAFIRGLLITLGEIFIEQGVDSGDIPAFVEGTVKSTLRSTVNTNFVATRYACFGDAPGATKPNLLGDTGNIGGSANTNEAEYALQGRNRQAWLVAKGVALPPLELLNPPTGKSVPVGKRTTFDATLAGGDGTPVTFDWKSLNTTTGATAAFSTARPLVFEYPLLPDAGTFVLYVCDGTWIRTAPAFAFDVTDTPFALATQPQGGIANVGSTFTFSVSAQGGTAVPAYQWMRGANSSNLAAIPGANGPSLVLENVQLGDAGLYQVMVTSGATTLTSSRVALVVQTVADTVPPIVTLNGNAALLLECGTSFVDPGATASDLVNGDVSSSIVVLGTVNTGVPGDYPITYRASDAAGNLGETVRTVTIADSIAPSLNLNGEASITLACGAPYVELGATATDACAGLLTQAITTSGTVNSGVPGEYTITYGVADPSGNSTTRTRTVTVVDLLPPTLALNGASAPTLACGAAYVEAGATAIDACAGGLTAFIQITGSVNTAAPGSYPLTYTVADAAGNSATAVRTVNVVDTVAPVVSLTGANPLVVACGSAFADPGATATDACAGTLNNVAATGSVNTTIPGSYTRSYTATDPSGNVATATRTIEVVDGTPPAVVLNGAAEITVTCKAAFTDPGATATDACAGSLSPVVEGAVNTATPGRYTLRYRATDPAGNAGEAIRVVDVIDDVAPIITLIGSSSLTVECGTSFSDPGASAEDACDGLLAAIGVTGSVNTQAPGSYTLTYRVADASGNEAEATRTVLVTDATAPLLTLRGASPVTVACGGTYEDAGATALDICDGDRTPQIASEGTVDTGTPGEYTLTYMVSDTAGNAATLERLVIVADTEAPNVERTGPAQITLGCGDSYTELGATATDDCSGALSDTLEILGDVNTNTPGTYTIVYRATDPAGNTGETTRSVVVLADCDILIDRQPVDLNLYEGSEAVFRIAASGGVGTLIYDWTFEGTSLGLPSDPRLVRTNITSQDAGIYTCIVSDGSSSVESEPATLAVFARPASGQQSADSDGNWSISLSELLRLIQFYNLRALSCDASSEDGYVPAAGDQSCAPHDTDYNPQDWQIILTELLRAIQFYNTPGGQYHRDETTEDGLAPGAA